MSSDTLFDSTSIRVTAVVLCVLGVFNGTACATLAVGATSTMVAFLLACCAVMLAGTLAVAAVLLFEYADVVEK